ncbi:hypothetical protein PIB30_040069 [Stylosanthes scabra]|uniref:Uncharacterized protein n=1 Tax=Stylosanthes scabra TaxID=79078 RepID=A0ABU6WEI9_9FABA|nr:hypothetical protein [Stylosanthes scabra]
MQQQNSCQNSEVRDEEEEETIKKIHVESSDLRNSNEQTAKEDDIPGGREIVYEGNDRFVEGRMDDIGLEPAKEVEAIRPSPAPPDLESTVTGACKDAEDVIDMEGTRRTFVAPVAGAATVTDGGLQAWQLRRVALQNPPQLLAAIFPWDRGGERDDDI